MWRVARKYFIFDLSTSITLTWRNWVNTRIWKGISLMLGEITLGIPRTRRWRSYPLGYMTLQMGLRVVHERWIIRNEEVLKLINLKASFLLESFKSFIHFNLLLCLQIECLTSTGYLFILLKLQHQWESCCCLQHLTKCNHLNFLVQVSCHVFIILELINSAVWKKFLWVLMMSIASCDGRMHFLFLLCLIWKGKLSLSSVQISIDIISLPLGFNCCAF